MDLLGGQRVAETFQDFQREIMSSSTAETNIEPALTSIPPDIIPVEIPFDVPYVLPISLAQARTGIYAAGIGH